MLTMVNCIAVNSLMMTMSSVIKLENGVNFVVCTCAKNVIITG